MWKTQPCIGGQSQDALKKKSKLKKRGEVSQSTGLLRGLDFSFCLQVSAWVLIPTSLNARLWPGHASQVNPFFPRLLSVLWQEWKLIHFNPLYTLLKHKAKAQATFKEKALNYPAGCDFSTSDIPVTCLGFCSGGACYTTITKAATVQTCKRDSANTLICAELCLLFISLFLVLGFLLLRWNPKCLWNACCRKVEVSFKCT